MRLARFTLMGLVLGLAMGFTPAAGELFNYPGIWLGRLCVACGLAPRDAGFIVCSWGIALQYVLAGFLVDLVLRWRSNQAKLPHQRAAGDAGMALQSQMKRRRPSAPEHGRSAVLSDAH